MEPMPEPFRSDFSAHNFSDAVNFAVRMAISQHRTPDRHNRWKADRKMWESPQKEVFLV
jgi:hypothetical protein